MITVVKLGGNIIDHPDHLEIFLNSFAKIPGKKILVHGGGKLATSLSESMGIKAEMINGRRITDEGTLKIVTMVYAGWINKSVVAKLQSLQCEAIGICGADGNLMEAKKRPAQPIDYGFVGDILENGINISMLEKLFTANLIPVIAPITHDMNGQLLNTNADTIASEIASALTKIDTVQLLYCFEKNGVLKNISDENDLFKLLKEKDAENLSINGEIHSGMLPKLKAGFQAKRKGVERVGIGNALRLESFLTENSNCTLLDV